MATLRHEPISGTPLTGASFSGLDGDINRTYTLVYTNAQSAMFTLNVQGSVWQQGRDYTISNDIITALIPMYNDFNIVIDYVTEDTGYITGSLYITLADVRRSSGVPSSLVSDAQVNSSIPIIQDLVAKWLNASFTPTEVIEIQDGNGLPRFFTRHNPLLSVKYCKSDDTVLNVAELNTYKPSGMIYLGINSNMGSFVAKRNTLIIKYIHGLVEENPNVKTTLLTASIAGTSVNLAVASSTAFSVSDWVEIYNVDGHREVAQVTNKGAGFIVVDELILTHSLGSTIVKVQIGNTIKRFMELEASIYVGISALGSSYLFNKSYTLGDFTTSKDGGAEHWTSLLKANIQERDYLKQTIKIRPAIVVQ
jgi:hypothetical protein